MKRGFSWLVVVLLYLTATMTNAMSTTAKSASMDITKNQVNMSSDASATPGIVLGSTDLVLEEAGTESATAMETTAPGDVLMSSTEIVESFNSPNSTMKDSNNNLPTCENSGNHAIWKQGRGADGMNFAQHLRYDESSEPRI